jgi:hypothetical protein
MLGSVDSSAQDSQVKRDGSAHRLEFKLELVDRDAVLLKRAQHRFSRQ